jgi:hypothetical protein
MRCPGRNPDGDRRSRRDAEDECGASICALYRRFTNGRHETDPNSSWSPPTALTTTSRFAAVLDRIARFAPTSEVGPVFLETNA